MRTLSLGRYVEAAELPAPPPSFDETSGVAAWSMYANDRIGDCTIAAAGHMIAAWTAARSGRPDVVSERAVLDAFERVKVVDPYSGEEGAVVLDVLKYWRNSGIGGHTIGAFTRVSVHDRTLVETAAWVFGGLYLGVQLPRTAQSQDVWDWTGSLTGPARPGSWGGHAVDVVRYDADGVTVVTWGALKRVTWSFWDRYVDECYCMISTDFLEQGKTPNGFDLAALQADLALVTA